MNNDTVKKNLRFMGYTPSRIDALIVDSLNRNMNQDFIIPSVIKSRVKGCLNIPIEWTEEGREVDCFSLNVIFGGPKLISTIKIKNYMQSFLDFIDKKAWLSHSGTLKYNNIEIIGKNASRDSFTITFITNFSRTVLEAIKESVNEHFKDFVSILYGSGTIGEREIDLVGMIDFKSLLDDYYESRGFKIEENKVEWFKNVTKDEDSLLLSLSDNLEIIESNVYLRLSSYRKEYYDVEGRRIVLIMERYPRMDSVFLQRIEDYELSSSSLINELYDAKHSEAEVRELDYLYGVAGKTHHFNGGMNRHAKFKYYGHHYIFNKNEENGHPQDRLERWQDGEPWLHCHGIV